MTTVYRTQETPGSQYFKVAYDSPGVPFDRVVKMTRVDEVGAITFEWEDVPGELREFTVNSPAPQENTNFVPPAGVYGTDAEGVTRVITGYAEHTDFDQVLADIGVTEIIDGEPPVDPATLPRIIGAVAAEPDLPASGPSRGVYLVRDSHRAASWDESNNAWEFAPWSVVEDYFQTPESDVPDLTVG